LDLLKTMKDEKIMPTAIAYNAGEVFYIHCTTRQTVSCVHFMLYATHCFLCVNVPCYPPPPPNPPPLSSHIRLREGKYDRFRVCCCCCRCCCCCLQLLSFCCPPQSVPLLTLTLVLLTYVSFCFLFAHTGTEPFQGFGNIRGDETGGSAAHRGDVLGPHIGVREGK
jgi:hypothetical protein